MLGDEVLPTSASSCRSPMVNRHGLIAGATGTGKTKTLQLLAGPAVGRRGARLRRRRQGRPLGLARARRSPPTPGRRTRCESLGWTFTPQGHPRRAPVALGHARRAGARHVSLVRAAAAGQGARPQRDPDLRPVAGVPLLRRQRPAAARPRRPADDAQVPRLGRGQAGAGGVRRHRPGHARACSCARSSRWSRRAPASSSASPSSTSTTCCAPTPDGKGVDHRCSSSRDVMDRPRLFSTFMLWMLAQLYEQLPEVGRPAEAQARLLLRRGAPAVRRRVARR